MRGAGGSADNSWFEIELLSPANRREVESGVAACHHESELTQPGHQKDEQVPHGGVLQRVPLPRP